MHHVVINHTQRAARILTQMRALSRVRLNIVQTVVQTVRPMQASPHAPRATLPRVPQHRVVKPLLLAVTAQHALALHAQVRRVLQQVRVVALPLTAVAVKS